MLSFSTHPPVARLRAVDKRHLKCSDIAACAAAAFHAALSLPAALTSPVNPFSPASDTVNSPRPSSRWLSCWLFSRRLVSSGLITKCSSTYRTFQQKSARCPGAWDPSRNWNTANRIHVRASCSTQPCSRDFARRVNAHLRRQVVVAPDLDCVQLVDADGRECSR
jgi:hypothetical protein